MKIKSAGVWSLLAVLRCYQIFLGPFFGGACKFYPSCSNYTYQAIERYGARRGIALAMKRLGRCRPFTKGGFDPVPDALDEEMLKTNQRVRLMRPGKAFAPPTPVEQERTR